MTVPVPNPDQSGKGRRSYGPSGRHHWISKGVSVEKRVLAYCGGGLVGRVARPESKVFAFTARSVGSGFCHDV